MLQGQDGQVHGVLDLRHGRATTACAHTSSDTTTTTTATSLEPGQHSRCREASETEPEEGSGGLSFMATLALVVGICAVGDLVRPRVSLQKELDGGLK